MINDYLKNICTVQESEDYKLFVIETTKQTIARKIVNKWDALCGYDSQFFNNQDSLEFYDNCEDVLRFDVHSQEIKGTWNSISIKSLCRYFDFGDLLTILSNLEDLEIEVKKNIDKLYQFCLDVAL